MQVLIGENCGIFSIYEFQSNTDAHGLQIHFEKEVKQFLNLLKKKKKKNHEGRNQYDACVRLPVNNQKLGDMGQIPPHHLRKEPTLPPPQTSSLQNCEKTHFCL